MHLCRDSKGSQVAGDLGKFVPSRGGVAQRLVDSGAFRWLQEVHGVQRKHFDQVVTSQGCVIQVRGHREVPFTPEEVASVDVNHKQWNFREATR